MWTQEKAVSRIVVAESVGNAGTVTWHWGSRFPLRCRAHTRQGSDLSPAYLEKAAASGRVSKTATFARASLFALLAWFFTVPVQAWTNDESQRTVLQVGAYGGPTYYVRIAEGVHVNCLNQRIDIDASTSLGRALFSLMVAAKAANQPVRIGYMVPPAVGICTLELAALD